MESPQTLEELHRLAEDLSLDKDRKGELERELKEINRAIEEDQGAMLEIMSAYGMTQFDHNGELFYQTIREFPTIIKLQEDRFKDWLRECGEAGIIKETINAKTLEGWWNRNEFRQEELVTSKLIEVFSKVSISRRKR